MPTTRERPPHSLRTDALVAAALAVGGCIMAWLSFVSDSGLFESALWQRLIGTVALAVPLVWRRQHPIGVMLVQTVIYIVAVEITGLDIYATQVMLFLGFYTVGAWEGRRGAALVSRTAVVVVMALWLFIKNLLFFESDEMPATLTAIQFMAIVTISATINVVFFVGGWVFGDRAWAQALEHEKLLLAGDEIHALQRELVDQAIETERLRIARELHDVVAHHVTAMSVQSAAARRMMATDPDAARDSLKHVESSARSAVAELRTMVMTLRAGETDPAATPTLKDLEALVDEANTSEIAVVLEHIGEGPPLSPVVELTLYRVAQEALTNAHKHAGAATQVVVRLRRSSGLVELEVSDNGRVAAHYVPGTGTGLIGMRERLAAVGGTLEAGSKPRGGFLVRASIPLAGAA